MFQISGYVLPEFYTRFREISPRMDEHQQRTKKYDFSFVFFKKWHCGVL